MIKLKRVTDRYKKISKSFSKREWKRFDIERGYSYKPKKIEFLASQDNKIVGYLNLEILGGAAYLSQLIVKKNLRGTGIGKALLNKFEEIAKKKKCHVAYLNTSEDHKKALEFYKRNGYKIIAIIPNNKFKINWFYLQKEIPK